MLAFYFQVVLISSPILPLCKTIKEDISLAHNHFSGTWIIEYVNKNTITMHKDREHRHQFQILNSILVCVFGQKPLLMIIPFRILPPSSKNNWKTECGKLGEKQKKAGMRPKIKWINARRNQIQSRGWLFHFINYQLDVNSILANSIHKQCKEFSWVGKAERRDQATVSVALDSLIMAPDFKQILQYIPHIA